MLEGEGQAVVDGCDPDAGVLAALGPISILHTDSSLQFGNVLTLLKQFGRRGMRKYLHEVNELKNNPSN